MTAITSTLEAVQSLPTGGDPVLDAAKWVVLVLILVGAASVPFMMIMNKKTKDKNENQLETAISGAGSTLYNQLIKQVEEYRKIADVAYKERNDLVNRVAKLEAMVIAFEQTKEVVDRLRVKLDLKDQEIRKLLEQGSDERKQFLEMLTIKEQDIVRRDLRIEQLEKVTTSLQIRLARDESRQQIPVCPYAPKSDVVIESIIPLSGRRLTDPDVGA